MSDHLTALDATFLELEQLDRSAHMHIGAVMLFEPPAEDGMPPLQRVQDEIEARLPQLPLFLQRLSTPHTGGLSWPSWEQDESFDIAKHVFDVELPSPSGERELLDWAGDYFSRRLDRTRPLWEIAITALADGRWAMITKTHHAMVDGVGSVDIGQTILDTEPAPAPRERREPQTGAGVPGAAEEEDGGLPAPISLAADVGGAWLRLVRGGVNAVRGALRAGADTAMHPDRAREALVRGRAMVELIYRDEVIAAPTTTLNGPIGVDRRLAVIRISLEDIKAVKRGLGGTVNDVVLAISTGGLRRLLLERGEDVPGQGLRAMVPVNIRAASERLAMGNKVTSLFVHLPVFESDPKARYVRQVEEAERLKSGTQAIGSSTLMDLTSYAPPVLHSFLARSLYATRLFNVTITNVPGPQTPLYAFGSRMREAWPLVPLAAEHALGIAVFSYDGEMFFCLNADRDAVPDLDRAAAGIERSLHELLALVGRKSESAPARI